MIKVSANIIIYANEIEISAIRASGPGGQNVNKVSSAIHLRFDIMNSSLPAQNKQRLIDLGDYRINKDGIIVIKAQRYKLQSQNKDDALQRLQDLLVKSTLIHKKRKQTKPSKAANTKRLDQKSIRSKLKSTRSQKHRDI